MADRLSMRAFHAKQHFDDPATARAGLPGVPGLVKRTILRSKAEPTLYFVQTFVDGDAQLGDIECDIVFDETADEGVEADDSDPWSFHVTVHVKPGGASIYEQWKITEGEGQRAARGFIKRTLLRAKSPAGVYYYQSFWESEAACQAYSQSEAFTSAFERLNPAAAFARPMQRHDCEIVLDLTACTMPAQ